MRRFLIPIFIIIFLLILPKSIFAQQEFSTSYQVTYDVYDSGITTVTEKVTLKNLTDKFYASSFNLTIGATEVENVSAFDDSGALTVSSKDLGNKQSSSLQNKTEINVTFSKQIIGKDKDYTFNLRFNSKDFAQKQGKIWQVTVPKISSASEVTNYNLNLTVPVGFGDPTSIIPEPRNVTESGGRLQFSFNKDQLKESGILANFGTNQLFDFELKYTLNNNGFLPALGNIPLPPNTDNQEVIIDEIIPNPENVTKDQDDNYLAWFKVDRKKTFDVKVKGIAKLSINKFKKSKLKGDEIKNYLSEQKYWETSNPSVKSKLEEIFRNRKNLTNKEKARLIYKFVTSALTYDQSRIKDRDFLRLGAVTALSNPDKALCQEFSDLFITLSRAAGVPARMLTGYAYTSNTQLRPLSLDIDALHAWPEYYDPDEGWAMIDPTWENTTGGVDYFSKFDLNHFVMTVRGTSSEEPFPADDTKVVFSESAFKPVSKLNIVIDTPEAFYAGFPAKAKIQVKNAGNYIYQTDQLILSSSKVLIKGSSAFLIPDLPPSGIFEYKFDLRGGSPLESYEDILQVRVGDEIVSKKIIIKPFFAHKYFSYAVGGVTALITITYLAILGLHLKRIKIAHPQKK